jgi:hypothetical protein
MTQPKTLAARVTALPRLPMNDLWALWDQHFPRRPANHNRAYVEGRVAYKLQEQALGGIGPDVRTRLINIGEGQSKLGGARRINDVRIVPGTVLIREYDNREHRVTALPNGGFETEGRQFKSLSAAARHIAGCQVSGPLFFGLIKAHRKSK